MRCPPAPEPMASPMTHVAASSASPVPWYRGGRLVPRNERPTGPTATIIPDASRYARPIRTTDSTRASSTIPAAYSTSDTTIGATYPSRSASTPHTHSKMNMPRPNIERAIPIWVGLARSWRSSSGTALSTHAPGHEHSGKATGQLARQRNVRVTLPHAGAQRQRLGSGRPHTRDAVLVGHGLVHPAVDAAGQLHTPRRGRGQLVGNGANSCIGRRERRWPQQIAVREPAVGQAVGLGGSALDRDVDVKLDRRRDLRRENLDHVVAESVSAIVDPDAVEANRNLVPQPALVPKPLWRNDDQAVTQVSNRLWIFVAEALPDVVGSAARRRPVHRRDLDRHQAAAALSKGPRGVGDSVGFTSAQTVMERNSAGPNVVTIATSRASRPRPITTRPTRLALLRGSNVHHRSPNQTSIQAAKSIGSAGGGT